VLHILEIIAPMFLLLGVGMAAGFFQRFRSAQAGLNAFVFSFSLPAYIFIAVADAPLGEGVPLSFVTISLGVTAASFAVAYLATSVGRRRGSTRGSAPGPFAVAATYGNVGYLGIPIAITVLGAEAALAAALGQLLHNVLFMVGYPLMKTIGEEARGARRERLIFSLWRIAKKAIVFNPIVIGVVAGVTVGLTGLRLPGVLIDATAMLGQAAVPVAMFAVGLAIKPAWEGFRSKSVSWVEVGVASVFKLAILPLATLLVVLALGDELATGWGATAVILACMPVSSTASILVYEYDGDTRVVGATTLVTSALAIATIPLLITLLTVL